MFRNKIIEFIRNQFVFEEELARYPRATAEQADFTPARSC